MHTRCGVVELTGSVECVMETLSACPEARGDRHDLRLAPDSPHRDNAEHQEGQWLVMSLSCHCHVTVISLSCHQRVLLCSAPLCMTLNTSYTCTCGNDCIVHQKQKLT